MVQRLNSPMAKTEAAVEVIAAMAQGTEAIEVVIGVAAAAIVAIEAVVTIIWAIECSTAIDLIR